MLAQMLKKYQIFIHQIFFNYLTRCINHLNFMVFQKTQGQVHLNVVWKGSSNYKCKDGVEQNGTGGNRKQNDLGKQEIKVQGGNRKQQCQWATDRKQNGQGATGNKMAGVAGSNWFNKQKGNMVQNLPNGDTVSLKPLSDKPSSDTNCIHNLLELVNRKSTEIPNNNNDNSGMIGKLHNRFLLCQVEG